MKRINSCKLIYRCIGIVTLAWLLAFCQAGPGKSLPAPPLRQAKPLAQPPGKAPERSIQVDEAWAGTSLVYDAISVGPVVYVAYYDAQRRLSVARVDTATGEVAKKALDSVFGGWDAHNSVTLAYDRGGYLHVAGNMHAAPLVYARTLRPNDFSSLARVDRMVGGDESSVTYPNFFFHPGGDLLFSYRSGRSGDGALLINRFDGGRWSRLLSKPLFAAASEADPVNAYPTGFIAGPDGYFHVAWVWRKTYLAETNFNVGYARSKDLAHWEDSRRRALELPITPANAEVVDAIPARGGLLNNIKLGFDTGGRPIISYLKYDGQGNSQLYHARLRADGWQVVQATDWKYRWEFSGGGTLPTEIYFAGVRSEANRMTEEVSHKLYGWARLTIDPLTLAARSTPIGSLGAQNEYAMPPAPLPFHAKSITIRPMSEDSVRGQIQWRTLAADNNDQPRSCESVGLPAACSMTSALQAVLAGGR
jgi:hypothetical protein